MARRAVGFQTRPLVATLRVSARTTWRSLTGKPLDRRSPSTSTARSRSTRATRSARSTPASSTCLRTWPISPSSETPASCGTRWWGTRPSWSTPTPASSVSPSTRTRGSPSTPSAPWSCTWARGGPSAGLTSLPSLRAPTRVSWTLGEKSDSELNI